MGMKQRKELPIGGGKGLNCETEPTNGCQHNLHLRNCHFQTMEETLYEPQYIVDMKVTSGRCFYLIKWRDFPISECTWEPTENLVNCDTLIAEYKNSEKNQPPKKELKKQGRKKRSRKESTLSTINSANLEERAADASFYNSQSEEGKPIKSAAEKFNYTTVTTLIYREQRKNTVRFKAELINGSSVWISDKDTHIHLKDQLIEFYERILNLKSRT